MDVSFIKNFYHCNLNNKYNNLFTNQSPFFHVDNVCSILRGQGHNYSHIKPSLEEDSVFLTSQAKFCK